MSAPLLRPQPPAAWLRLLPVCAALLAGCPTMPTLPGGPAGSSLIAPAAKTGEAPAAGTSVKAENTSAQTNVKQRDSVGAGKAGMPLSTFEGDLLCSRLVAPFDLASNVGVLMDTLGQSSLEAVGAWLGQSAGTVTKAVAAQSRYQIPYEMRAAAVRLNWLPMRAEQLYGRMMLEKMTSSLLERDARSAKARYEVADRILADLLGGISEPHEYQFEIHVRTAGETNAIALPGGIIVVDAGLLDLPDKSKAYFAVSHEIAHILQRHETRAVQARIVDSVALGSKLPELTRQINLTSSDPKVLFTAVLAGKLQFERHAEVQELHADGCAVRVLKAGLQNPQRVVGVVSVFAAGLKPDPVKAPSNAAAAAAPGAQKLVETVAAVDSLVDIVVRPIDRHPTTKERVDFLKTSLDALRGQLPAKTTKPPVPALTPRPVKPS